MLSKTQTHNNLEHARMQKDIPDFTQQSKLGLSKQTLLEQFLLFINFWLGLCYESQGCVWGSRDVCLKDFIKEALFVIEL